ncbi:MAG: hypothetical protein IKZ35_05145 [Clostridia bacterium]|nr:hypothetical protein [Clostridia bacterium]
MKICIADINIQLEGVMYDYLKYRLRNYIIPEDKECDIIVRYKQSDKIDIPDGEIMEKKDYKVFAKGDNCYYYYDLLKEETCSAIIRFNENWTSIDCELFDVEDLGGASLNIRQFNMIGHIVKYIMINHLGMSLHSSSISYKNNGIMFSADSGTGKSTHTRLWMKVFDGVEIINDDMPVIRMVDGVWYLYGCPWSGKTEINVNKRVPLKALVFLERGKTNEIERIYAPESVFKIISQTIVASYKDIAKKALGNISKMVESVPIYRLKCTISDEAPKVVAKELDLI